MIPSTTEEVQPDGEVVAELARLGVTELLHFTTNIGLTGILDDQMVRSRAGLPLEKHLASVYPPNARRRYDVAWLDHVNLSISRINLRFFHASEEWHRHEDVWWCALAFDPVVSAHDRVHFATTNNRYSGCRRVPGVDGLRSLWAPRIFQYRDAEQRAHIATRTEDHMNAWPTCRQAEVLYPNSLGTRWLRRIYVVNELHADIAHVASQLFAHDPISIEIRPDVFA